MNHETEEMPPVEIPLESLTTEAVNGVIENFILREGTDYGVSEVPYEVKAKQVLRQIEKGDVKIAFDPNTETVTLLTNKEWKKLTRQRSESF